MARNPWGKKQSMMGGRSINAQAGSRIRRSLRRRRTRCGSCGGDGVQVELVERIRIRPNGKRRIKQVKQKTPCRACNTTGSHQA